ncbi:CLUMA_CG016475, isoform A [Clunio marinus]|uniref:CLUMA_CG016475, isoform A n=1 Tax=Clunio marinus TaxID=568069 RepID=A0A1J1IV64_9DIPT|nr:CLUMA_CG016475, isoform A [Clunio marinus]
MHKPLKRFTQCGSLTMLFTVFVVMFSLSSTALTTFGIYKPQNQPAAPTQTPKGKDCNTNMDCVGIVDTSCVKDVDYKSRCLCGDFRAPNNGICSARMKGLRHQCRRTEDCEDYMVCRENNSTKTTLGSLSKDSGIREKLCLCDEDNGYMENIIENHCNAAVKNFIASIFGYMVAIIFYFFVTQKFLTY